MVDPAASIDPALGAEPVREDAILDAARATVLDFGVQRTTVTEVARRAGLSRMTVYRRYADGTELIRALMAREFGTLLAEVEPETARGPSPRAGVVTAAVRTAQLLLVHPLLLRLLELEPEVLLPYMTGRVGRFQALARKTLARAIAAGQEEGSIRSGDPATLAAAVETAARGLVFSARAHGPGEAEVALRELELMLDAYLRP